MHIIKHKSPKITFIAAAILPALALLFLQSVTYAAPTVVPATTQATTTQQQAQTDPTYQTTTTNSIRCGDIKYKAYMSIDIGCEGKGNPIADGLFAVIRFLSNGVGLVVIGSIIFGGIQYTTSRGDPQATQKALTRIRSSVIALVIFIFGYAILNYLIPGAFLK